MAPVVTRKTVTTAAVGVASGLAVGTVLFLLMRPASASPKPASFPSVPDQPALPPWRKAMLARAIEHVNNKTLYQWGGGHGWVETPYGLDCSGFIMDCAKAAGFVLQWNSNGVWQHAMRVDQPQPADVALYGSNDKATHIVLIETINDPKGIQIIGSNDGGHLVTTPEIAIEQGAFVKRAPLNYRQDLLGFCSLEDLAVGKRVSLASESAVFDPESNWG